MSTNRRFTRSAENGLFTHGREPAGRNVALSGLPALTERDDCDTRSGGVRRDRTDDLKLAKLALSQLSYDPNPRVTPRVQATRPTDTRGCGGPGKI